MPATLMGRMPKPDDPDIIARFADATRKGHPVATAATLAGIEQSTASRWLVQGADEAQERPDGAPGSHVAFATAHKAALAELVDSRLGRIEAAGERGNWQADMTLLERRMPREFGRNDRLQVQSEVRVISVQLDQLPDDERHALGAALLSERSRALPAPGDTTGGDA